MEAEQRRVVAWSSYAVAAILFVFYFLRPLWAWATWNEARGTLDLGFLKVTTRPPFPGDARGVLVGLVIPVVLVAIGRLAQVRRS